MLAVAQGSAFSQENETPPSVPLSAMAARRDAGIREKQARLGCPRLAKKAQRKIDAIFRRQAVSVMFNTGGVLIGFPVGKGEDICPVRFRPTPTDRGRLDETLDLAKTVTPEGEKACLTEGEGILKKLGAAFSKKLAQSTFAGDFIVIQTQKGLRCFVNWRPDPYQQGTLRGQKVDVAEEIQKFMASTALPPAAVKATPKP